MAKNATKTGQFDKFLIFGFEPLHSGVNLVFWGPKSESKVEFLQVLGLLPAKVVLLWNFALLCSRT